MIISIYYLKKKTSLTLRRLDRSLSSKWYKINLLRRIYIGASVFFWTKREDTYIDL